MSIKSEVLRTGLELGASSQLFYENKVVRIQFKQLGRAKVGKASLQNTTVTLREQQGEDSC